MELEQIMKLVDAAHALDKTLAQALREIDRRALNALVLVKRHGTALVGYGVVAQAFRERATALKEAAQTMQAVIPPLIQTQMRILQHKSYADAFADMIARLGEKTCPTLTRSQSDWEQFIAHENREADALIQQLIIEVDRLQAGIAEQAYVVVNGRIEAALSESTGAPLARVSRDMGDAVEVVSRAVGTFRSLVEESMT